MTSENKILKGERDELFLKFTTLDLDDPDQRELFVQSIKKLQADEETRNKAMTEENKKLFTFAHNLSEKLGEKVEQDQLRNLAE